MKTTMSRFQIHGRPDRPGRLRCPCCVARSLPAGQLPNFLGVPRRSSPAALRGYARFRASSSAGGSDARRWPGADLTRRLRAVRIRPRHRAASAPPARPASGLDEVAKAREFDLRPNPKQGGTPDLPQGGARGRRRNPVHLMREARELGWDATSSCYRRSPSHRLEVFTAMVNVAG